ncbi:aldo/keto reductase [Streptomyces sp. NP160]|uniref:aldo/keto reductase n=1 Tax=Streptomyces sp. NP160 TaxID=2586637 RepID=UPI00111AB5F8|nr:aldo/keto reductase [Streptomyces sp. NP160]TNM68648.1 aldo/keto reductase [Streptomyces sp. NP160]
MPTREVRSTGVHLTTLGFGAAVIGNLFRAVDDDTARAAVDAAWDAGIRYFDTAPHYGVGLSERRLGEALRGRPRDEFVISSKVGRLLRPRQQPLEKDDDGFDVPGDVGRVRDYSRDGVLRSIEETLQRTGLDRLDVVYVHDPDAPEELDQVVAEGLPALVELREQGVVGAVGAGMNYSAPLTRVLRETDADVVMLAGRYTLLEQGALDDVLPAALELGRAVVAVGVFNSGLLARQEVPDDANWNYEQAPPHVLARARELAALCAEHGTTLPAAAVAFALRHPAVVGVVLGMRTPQQVERNAALLAEEPAGGWQPLWDDLADRGLVRTP